MPIDLREDNERFFYRAGGLALQDGHILLNWSELNRFWFLPGGRVEIGEDTDAALRREFLEETGLEIAVGPVVYTAEGFYEAHGRREHELEIARRVEIVSSPPLGMRLPTLDAPDEYVEWHALASLSGLPLKPPFLATLDLGKDEPVHVVWRR